MNVARNGFRGWTAILCALTLGCASQATQLAALSTKQPGPYLLGSGDEVRVTVVGLATSDSSYRVDDTGMIALPMLQPIMVRGKTVREAEAAVAAALRVRRIVLDPNVSVQVQTYRPFFISGEVQRPGQYAFVPGMSLMTAVSIAGGYTFRADKKTALVTRASIEARAAPGTPIQPGDLIVVRERWF